MTQNTQTYLNGNDGTGLIGFGQSHVFELSSENTLASLQSFVDEHKGKFIFCALSYELKTQTMNLSSNNEDHHQFPLALLWVPDTVVELHPDGSREYRSGTKDEASESFIDEFFAREAKETSVDAMFESRLSKDEYLRKVVELKKEIQYGNIYEVNFCQEFFANDVHIDDPVAAYFQLNRITKAPFSCYVDIGDFRILSGSPERYIKREGNKLISEPIKGTSRRGKTAEEDEQLKKELLHNPKERSENVMIVDLVRNDLSILANKGSVEVEELFGIYTFETVHQMISRVVCEIDESLRLSDVLKASFPMGSMTGAPKHKAVQLIEEHEMFQRGIYSGSIGYIAPNGDFDFNVIIRTLIYNARTNYLSCPVGGAITIQSSPEDEFEECNTKIKRILDGMNGKD